MELELGLKFNRVVGDFSPTEFKIAKDRSGPIFLSRETDALFILTAHLKGFTKQNIKIDINKDGTLIVIKGEKKVQETVLLGWKLYKKDTEIRGFKKAFKIPDDVILDKITANFNEDESILTILMPKKVKGIRGMEIEEVKEESVIEQVVENVDDEKPHIDQTLVDKKHKEPDISTGNEAESSGLKQLVEEVNGDRREKVNDDRQEEVNGDQQEEVNDEQQQKVNGDRKEEVNDEQQQKVNGDRKEEVNDDQQQKVNVDRRERVNDDRREEVNEDGVRPDGDGIEHDHEDDVIKQPEVAEESGDGRVEENLPEERFNKMCIPVIAGSAFIVSFVVFVIQMIRSKHQDSKRKN